MPRFVILEHDHPVLHWDLMLQEGDVLRTWRLAEPPSGGAFTIAAEPLPDHRLIYLDYEGPVSGGRGIVKRWDGGKYECIDDNQWSFAGLRLRGVAEMECVDGQNWRFQRSAELAKE